jgi:20S proteasome subunit alpha 7
MVHDEAKDKDFELELTWICPESNNIHCCVPTAIKEDAEKLAAAALDDEMEED